MQPNFRNPQPAPPFPRGERLCSDVMFRASCGATAMFVLVRSHPRGVRLLSSMQRVGGGDEWGVTLRLPPGGYRYRYFADLGGTLVHVAPADVEHGPVAMRRFDATFYAGDRVQPDVVQYAR